MPRRTKLATGLIDLNLAYQALHSANDGITIVDMQQKDEPLIFVNRAFLRMTGYKKKEVLGKNCRFLQGNLAQQPEVLKIRNALNSHKKCRVVLKNVKKDGSLFLNELSLAPIIEADKTVSYYIGIQKDVTHEFLQKQQIAYLADHDELTGLDNYRGFFAKINDLLVRGKKQNLYLAIGIADINSFKQINDQYGHVKGNKILKLIGLHCAIEFRDYDIIARFGGDEFCFACLTQHTLSSFFYEKINTIINKVNHDLENPLEVSMSAGIHIEKITTKTRIDKLIHLADCNMYKNKHSINN
ncbi:regulatory protein (GGDEF and EAL domains) [Legionella busanensis]|uniref:Regulatory protein (GGDEF and EAL domains) n=1 Tax=Legionella busanensis TaxID=190655 RepID=A0A378KIB5_9GAMM|nr:MULTISPECIES: GGDEF domain-containing protein [Legionella]STX81514.1 regulatory protein (GGDEF and EAL domains) [Legionella busanensis]